MIKSWLEERAKRWLTDRGYWVIPSGIPVLIVSMGVGTFKPDGGGTTYHIHMPKGHKLWTVNQTVLSAEK
jgi:hypothetical protein